MLSDYVDPVLCNLRDCVHMNAGSSSGSSGSNGAASGGGSEANGHAVPNGHTVGSGHAVASGCGATEEVAAGRRAELAAEAAGWDPEDASECGSDDFDALLGEAAGSGGEQQGPEQGAAAHAACDSWDAPPMFVRYYDWQDSVDALPLGERAALLAALAAVPACTTAPPGGTIDVASNAVGAPALGEQERYDFILGTDVLYEW